MKVRTRDYTVLNPLEMSETEMNYLVPQQTQQTRRDVDVVEFMDDVIQMLKNAAVERAQMMQMIESIHQCARNMQQQQQQSQSQSQPQTRQYKKSPCGGSGSGKYTFGDGW